MKSGNATTEIYLKVLRSLEAFVERYFRSLKRKQNPNEETRKGRCWSPIQI